MTLQERFAETLTRAQEALEAGELEKGKTLRTEAETLKAALTELDANAGGTAHDGDAGCRGEGGVHYPWTGLDSG